MVVPLCYPVIAACAENIEEVPGLEPGSVRVLAGNSVRERSRMNSVPFPDDLGCKEIIKEHIVIHHSATLTASL